MYTEGASGVFIAVVVGIMGAIVLSAAGLFVLREQTPIELVTPSATESIASESAGAESASPSTADAVASTPVATDPPSTLTATQAPSSSPTAATATPTETPEPELEYVVVAGDGVEILATRFGIPADEIIERNNLQPPYTLSIGQVLIIPTDE